MGKISRMARRKFIKDATLAGAVMAAAPGAYSRVRGQGQGAAAKPGTGDWVRFGYDLYNTRFNPKETFVGKNNVAQLKPKWAFETDAPIQTTPTVIGDTLFFGTISGYQHALESATGKLKWKFFAGYNTDPEAANQGVRSSCHYENGRIYFGTGLAKVHCLDAATGKEIWQTQLDDDPLGNLAQSFCSPAVYNGKVYAATSSSEARIVCLDAKTGKIRWDFYVVEKSRHGGGSVWTSPAIDEATNTVYYVTGSLKSYMPPDPMLFSESIIAFDADTGEMIWYDQARNADAFDLDFSCHPMIFDAIHPAREREVRQCVGAGNKAGFYCFNRHTGERYWKVMLTNSGGGGGPVLNSTAVGYNRVYVVSNATGIRGRQGISVAAALHAYTGDIMWWVANEATISGPVAVANRVFYQGLADGTLEAIDATSGEQLWKHQFPGMNIRGGMAISNGVLYTSTGDTLGWKPDPAGKGKTYGVYAFTPNGQ